MRITIDPTRATFRSVRPRFLRTSYSLPDESRLLRVEPRSPGDATLLALPRESPADRQRRVRTEAPRLPHIRPAQWPQPADGNLLPTISEIVIGSRPRRQEKHHATRIETVRAQQHKTKNRAMYARLLGNPSSRQLGPFAVRPCRVKVMA